MSPFSCDAQELHRVKDALTKNDWNYGVGVLHEPTGCIRLAPFDDVPGGHAELADNHQLPRTECKGFVIAKRPDGTFRVENLSHLNGLQGQSGSLQMPATTFAAIVQAMQQAGL